jgi:hypothetical protein
MKTTSFSTFIITAVCTVALSSNAVAGGHGHGHGRGMNPHMMPGDGMGMGGMGGTGKGGMTATERSFFVNDAKASAPKTSAAPTVRNH